jgi:hypothetical protein
MQTHDMPNPIIELGISSTGALGVGGSFLKFDLTGM